MIKYKKWAYKIVGQKKTDEEQKKEIMTKATNIIFFHGAVCYRYWIIQIGGRENCRENSLWYGLELEWDWAICWRAKNYTQILGIHTKKRYEKKNIYTLGNVNIELSHAIKNENWMIIALLNLAKSEYDLA